MRTRLNFKTLIAEYSSLDIAARSQPREFQIVLEIISGQIHNNSHIFDNCRVNRLFFSWPTSGDSSRREGRTRRLSIANDLRPPLAPTSAAARKWKLSPSSFANFCESLRGGTSSSSFLLGFCLFPYASYGSLDDRVSRKSFLTKCTVQ